VGSKYFDLCTSVCLYITFAAQNNLAREFSEDSIFKETYRTGHQQAFDFIQFIAKFLGGNHKQKNNVLAFYGPHSTGKTKIFTLPLLSFMKSNGVINLPSQGDNKFYLSGCLNKSCVLFEEFALVGLSSETFLTWFGGEGINVEVKHNNAQRLDPMPILMTANTRPGFAYEDRFNARMIQSSITWDGFKGNVPLNLYPLCVWFATKVPLDLYEPIVSYMLDNWKMLLSTEFSTGTISERVARAQAEVLAQNSSWFNPLYESLVNNVSE
jgi:hypothetical protein